MSDRNIERMIEYLILKGWTEKEIKDLLFYIVSGKMPED